jgi:hypothetical protein
VHGNTSPPLSASRSGEGERGLRTGTTSLASLQCLDLQYREELRLHACEFFEWNVRSAMSESQPYATTGLMSANRCTE